MAKVEQLKTHRRPQAARAGMPEIPLRGEGLTKAYGGRTVVDHVNVRVNPGEVVGLLGPNGAGKTTTFYMLVGLVKPDKGSVMLGPDDITTLPLYQRARRGISYLPQEPSVFRKLTVEENILAVLETQDGNGEERHTKLEGLLEQLGLAHIRKNRGHALSGGERRRVEIARALCIHPSFILLDEPFSGIDPIAVLDLQKIIYALKESGIGILITDHNVRDTFEITDRSYIINLGEILVSGTKEELLANETARQIYLGNEFSM